MNKGFHIGCPERIAFSYEVKNLLVPFSPVLTLSSYRVAAYHMINPEGCRLKQRCNLRIVACMHHHGVGHDHTFPLSTLPEYPYSDWF